MQNIEHTQYTTQLIISNYFIILFNYLVYNSIHSEMNRLPTIIILLATTRKAVDCQAI